MKLCRAIAIAMVPVFLASAMGLVDWSGLAPEQAESRLEALLESDRRHGFDFLGLELGHVYRQEPVADQAEGL